MENGGSSCRHQSDGSGPGDSQKVKLHASVGEFNAHVEFRRAGERAFATVGDNKYELEIQRSQAAQSLLIWDGQVFDCRVEGELLSGQTLDVIVGTNRYAVTLTDPKRLRSAASAGAHEGGAANVVAPMPGKVVRILVEAGAEIEAGAGIMVVEAMKMQNEMKSPKAGVVAALNVEVGATVNGGDVLAIVE